MTLRLILFVVAVLVIGYILWDHTRKSGNKNRYIGKNKPVNNDLESVVTNVTHVQDDVQYNLEYDIEHEILSKSDKLSLGNLGQDLDNNAADVKRFGGNEIDDDSKLFDEEFAFASGVALNNESGFNTRDQSMPKTRESVSQVNSTPSNNEQVRTQYKVGSVKTDTAPENKQPTNSHDYLDPNVSSFGNQNNNTSKQQSIDNNSNSNTNNNSDMSGKQEQKIFYFHVQARNNSRLSGDDLLQALLSIGCRYGDSDIFHRHEKASGQGRVMFSVASMINPGSFDIDNMQNLKCPGVVLFFIYPGVSNPLVVYDLMLKSAYQLANLLDADVLDDNRHILTSEKAALNRQMVEDLEISEFF